VVDGLGRREPNHGKTPAGSVFQTSYDYHSSVHAHWAALSMARTTGDSALEKRVMSRLTPQSLETERTFLKNNPTFELPYGQAWMLVMTRELQQKHAAGNTPTTRALRAETEARVLDYLERSPFPELPLGQFNAAHDSWLFAYALLKQSQPGSAASARMKALEARIDQTRPALASTRPEPSDFLDLNAVLGVIDRTPPMKTPLKPYPPGKAGTLPRGRIELADVHSVGTAAMQVWPYAMDAAAGRGSVKPVHDRIAQMRKRPELYKTGFETTTHWVPQFMWMAMVRQAGAF
jgi:hypothetical protein